MELLSQRTGEAKRRWTRDCSDEEDNSPPSDSDRTRSKDKRKEILELAEGCGSEDRLDEEDFVPPSDSDRSIGGGISFCVNGEPILKGKEERKCLYGKDKGKAVIEISDGDPMTDDGEDSDYDQHVMGRRKMVSKKKRERPIYRKEHGEKSNAHIHDLEEAGGDLLGALKEKKEKKKRKGEPRHTLLWEVWEEENERWIDANETVDADLDRLDEEVAETAEPPPDLFMTLLRYQKEWLAWALKQEDSPSRGGILADEMGMGKTIQAIALVLAKRSIRQMGCGSGVPSPSPSSSMVLPEIKCTLVICPVVAVLQWMNEIDRCTQAGSTRVLVYHGPKRKKCPNQFSEYDFVLTTYSILEAEYRKKSSKAKMKSACVEGQTSESEDNEVKRADKKTKKHGKRDKEPRFSSYDENLAGVDQGTATRKSILHSVKWDRIILDEAHFIKDRHSSTAKAVLGLESSYKWALSGTPLQNHVGELYSLVRFLQITPYSYYFCSDCDCKLLDYSSTTECPNCVHKSMRHFCWWNKYVATPISVLGNVDGGRRAIIFLKHKLLKSIVLRRTKKGRAADLALPPIIVSLRRDSFDIEEEDYYKSLYNKSRLQFNTYVQAGTLLNNYAHIFELLTRLRQAVDHPHLVIYSKTATLKSGSTSDTDNAEQVSGICHEAAEDPVVTSCAHVVCKACLIDFSAAFGQVSCPSCSKPLTVDFTSKLNPGGQGTKTTIKGFKQSSILSNIRPENFRTSTKIDALREEIRFMIERDGSAKGIVFSQFTSFLDLINYSLQKSGINCVQLLGRMTMAARDTAIKRFTNDPDCKIFLISLKAGGVALNLTVASHVFLMDPWWNPAVERQAQDRIHRIGQYKPIRIIRFIIENTIEERILKLQEKKELVFEGTVGGSSEALVKLTEADLRFLFNT